jgi:methylmalonyl-CoA mutase N-terminal domain/subunit
VKRTYTALDIADTPLEDIGLPGHIRSRAARIPTMYRGRFWTMRQIAGFGTAEDTNQRFKYLIAQGQTGLSTDFDMPTLMGYDSDHPMSEGEVGREGVAIDTLADMEHLLRRHRPREDLGVADDQPERVDPARDVRRARAEARPRHEQAVGHDPGRHPEGVPAQKEWIFPIAPSVRIVRDCITYCART